jgi:hypothetical protein
VGSLRADADDARPDDEYNEYNFASCGMRSALPEE